MEYPKVELDENGEIVEIKLPEDRALRIRKDIGQVMVIDYFKKEGVWLKFGEIKYLYEIIDKIVASHTEGKKSDERRL